MTWNRMDIDSTENIIDCDYIVHDAREHFIKISLYILYFPDTNGRKKPFKWTQHFMGTSGKVC